MVHTIETLPACVADRKVTVEQYREALMKSNDLGFMFAPYPWSNTHE